MSKLFQSKKWVGVLLAVVILGICLTFTMRQVWWCFIDIFFFFMAAFLPHVTYFGKSKCKGGSQTSNDSFGLSDSGRACIGGRGDSIIMRYVILDRRLGI